MDPNGNVKSSDIPVCLNVKYENEIRLSLGVGMKRVNGTDIGVRLEAFSYTGKLLVTRKTLQTYIDAEIKRVKALKNMTKECLFVTDK